MAGRSRSATLTIAYLLWKAGTSQDSKYRLYDILSEVQTKRPIVQPNGAFLKQLVHWEDELKSAKFAKHELNDTEKSAISEIKQITQRIKEC